MFDSIPPQVWLTIPLLAAGLAALRYIVRYVADDPSRRDVAAPKIDLSWRRRGLLVRKVVIVTAVAALGVFIWTPSAERFAGSPQFLPVLLAVMAGGVLYMAIEQWLSGRAQPIIRGFGSSYDRTMQPRRFWLALTWNICLGLILAGIGIAAFRDIARETCTNGRERVTAEDRIAACSTLITRAAEAGDDATDIYAARGYAYHQGGRLSEAFGDYSRAITGDPQDSYSLYNRGIIFWAMGRLDLARQDIEASLRLREDNASGHLSVGMISLERGDPHRAIAALDRAEALGAPTDEVAAHRGLSYTHLGDHARAERDFARVPASSNAYWVVQNGRGLRALRESRFTDAIGHFSAALARNPANDWTLRQRARAYRALGDDAAADRDTAAAAALDRQRDGGRR